MASANIYKADCTYGQVAPLDMEDPLHLHKSPPPRHLSTTTIKILAASAVLILLLLIIAITLAAVFATSSHSSSRGSSDPQPHQLDSTESIRLICNVTRYPDSCFSTISSLNASPSPDPEQILNLSIRVCFNHVITVAASINNTISNSDAVKDCSELYDDARGRIGDAMETMEPGLTEGKVNDVQTWLSAALTDQETCLDGLEEMPESVKVKLVEFKVNAEKLKEYLSNSLAIVANIHILLEKFGLKLH